MAMGGGTRGAGTGRAAGAVGTACAVAMAGVAGRNAAPPPWSCWPTCRS